jgi:hypothetical protein
MAFHSAVKGHIYGTINGVEKGMYISVLKEQPDRIKLMSSNYHPFITLFKDLHELFFTKSYNDFFDKPTAPINESFDKLSFESKHSKHCLLSIIANLTVSVHFNLDRTKFDCTNLDSYVKTLNLEIDRIISMVNFDKLFEHECNMEDNITMKKLAENAKFITIDISTKKPNNVNEKLKNK